MGSTLERLIALDGEERSDHRRAVLRDVTDMFMTAPDRYGRRDMSVFDLLLSRTAQALDIRIRRAALSVLEQYGVPRDDIATFAEETTSPNETFLRRSVTQTAKDIFLFLREHTDDMGEDAPVNLEDGHSLQLPSALPFWIAEYHLKYYADRIRIVYGTDAANAFTTVLRETRDEIISSAIEAGRTEIVIARRTVKDWSRQGIVNDTVLAELLEARAMTEFIFASSALFDIDTCTMVRVLNDASFESLAVIAKSKNVRRSILAKTLFGFRRRRTDEGATERLLPLYDLLPQETAERAVRFWRVRVSELNGSTLVGGPASNEKVATIDQATDDVRAASGGA